MFFHEKLDIASINASETAKIDAYCGLAITAVDNEAGTLTAEVVVEGKLLQPFGLLHGGVTCLFAESIGSVAANLTLPKTAAAVGQSLSAQHISSARSGDRLRVQAAPVHCGRSSQVWDIEIYNLSRDKLVSRVCLTMANIEKPRS